MVGVMIPVYECRSVISCRASEDVCVIGLSSMLEGKDGAILGKELMGGGVRDLVEAEAEV